MDHALLEVLIRLHCERDVKRKTRCTTDSESEINAVYLKSKKFDELCIPKDVSAFISDLKGLVMWKAKILCSKMVLDVLYVARYPERLQPL